MSIQLKKILLFCSGLIVSVFVDFIFIQLSFPFSVLLELQDCVSHNNTRRPENSTKYFQLTIFSSLEESRLIQGDQSTTEHPNLPSLNRTAHSNLY